mgnify:CR=1 FL=1
MILHYPIVDAYTRKYNSLYEVQKTVENETDMLEDVKEAKTAGCNALVVFLGNFGPETPETLIAKEFDGPYNGPMNSDQL